MKVKDWLQQGSKAAKKVSPLDKELILCYNGLGIDRLQLILRADEELLPAVQARIDADLARRAAGEPLAYILGWREFYGRKFSITPDVLIPRPETESLVDCVLESVPPGAVTHILEIGTGAGVIAITLKLERPTIEVTATDISPQALQLARRNAQELGATVQFLESDLLASRKLPSTPPAAIVANLPYVDRDWSWTSPELSYEPEAALYAADGGLAVIKRLIQQAAQKYPRVPLILESDPSQQAAIAAFGREHGYLGMPRGDYVTLLLSQAEVASVMLQNGFGY